LKPPSAGSAGSGPAGAAILTQQLVLREVKPCIGFCSLSAKYP
jgi:hypothetical protein